MNNLINNIDIKESMRYRQSITRKRVLQAKLLFRVSHFNPARIALTSFFYCEVVLFTSKKHLKSELKEYNFPWNIVSMSI